MINLTELNRARELAGLPTLSEAQMKIFKLNEGSDPTGIINILTAVGKMGAKEAETFANSLLKSKNPEAYVKDNFDTGADKLWKLLRDELPLKESSSKDSADVNKLSDLIAALEAIKKDQGDISVAIVNRRGEINTEGVTASVKQVTAYNQTLPYLVFQ